MGKESTELMIPNREHLLSHILLAFVGVGGHFSKYVLLPHLREGSPVHFLSIPYFWLGESRPRHVSVSKHEHENPKMQAGNSLRQIGELFGDLNHFANKSCI